MLHKAPLPFLRMSSQTETAPLPYFNLPIFRQSSKKYIVTNNIATILLPRYNPQLKTLLIDYSSKLFPFEKYTPPPISL